MILVQNYQAQESVFTISLGTLKLQSVRQQFFCNCKGKKLIAMLKYWKKQTQTECKNSSQRNTLLSLCLSDQLALSEGTFLLYFVCADKDSEAN